jgi:hypothetical protein
MANEQHYIVITQYGGLRNGGECKECVKKNGVFISVLNSGWRVSESDPSIVKVKPL